MRASRRIEQTCAKRFGPVGAKRTTRFHGADLHFACAARGATPPKTVPRGRDSASGLRGGPCRRQPIFGPVGESLRRWREGCTAMLRRPLNCNSCGRCLPWPQGQDGGSLGGRIICEIARMHGGSKANMSSRWEGGA